MNQTECLASYAPVYSLQSWQPAIHYIGQNSGVPSKNVCMFVVKCKQALLRFNAIM